jgi:hypothetical protein
MLCRIRKPEHLRGQTGHVRHVEIDARQARIGLLVVANAASKIAYLGHKANVLNRRRVCARLWPHVADLGDLTFLGGGVDVLAPYLACRILEGPNILTITFFAVGLVFPVATALPSLILKRRQLFVVTSAARSSRRRAAMPAASI